MGGYFFGWRPLSKTDCEFCSVLLVGEKERQKHIVHLCNTVVSLYPVRQIQSPTSREKEIAECVF